MYKSLLVLFLSFIFINHLYAQNLHESQTSSKTISGIKNIEIKDYQEINVDDAWELSRKVKLFPAKEIRWINNETIGITAHDGKSLIQFVNEEKGLFFTVKTFYSMKSPDNTFEILFTIIHKKHNILMELKVLATDKLIELPYPNTHTTLWFSMGNWSSDSRSFVFERNKDIYKITIPNKNEFETDDISLLELAEGTHPKFSPNGLMIAYIYDDSYLYIMDNNGKNQREIFNAGDRRITNFEWSPDGDKIGFTDAASEKAKLKIAIFH